MPAGRLAKPLEAIAGPLRRSSPESVDRMLIGLCAVIWLAFVGMLVGAIVVIAGMGEDSGSSGSSWGIYIVIGVSLTVIVGAVPLLLRARKSAAQRTARGASKTAPKRKGANSSGGATAPSGPPPAEASTEKLKTFGGLADHVSHVPKDYNGPGSPAYRAATEAAAKRAVINRLWLRATVGIAGAIGLALLAVVTGTYLLAVESDTAAVIAFVFAGVITCAMGAIPWVTLKKLRELGSSGS
ncbi:Conserved membrane protein of uncharacterised function [Mycobacteroides abscessus subsp. abscessus]|uniref:Transmembrane protein n=4 Tax=Mycobacteroides abscessus TaxID=36809 RepID=A0A829PP92_9MYCO|nr:DUF2561 family protein [Mycobacteroides abscessus]ETZ88995.1 hypothetical protein L829_2569 [Mycobacteroides abscessus MAB_030201_1075]ETZ95583.1 hypothetical protein L828_4627 [Mycobacteroides abscessus MAB_030201_1061]EUA47347.1 hypothetical protein I543_2066 [Mycobacteroides abscessus 21]EIC62788.1 hypothetical protein S7W_22784 [Mycobacteroides abscessus M94]ETZ71599.1 hypothetical protein L835_4539 [Mycobacteroides abscessus MAB_110811_1470]